MATGTVIRLKRKAGAIAAGQLAAGEMGLDTSKGVVSFSTDGANLRDIVPSGVIVMWGGLLADIPAGWLLCDGQNGTPDLRDRFVRGAAAGADPGATGGAATHAHADHASHTHTYTQVPNHVHVQTVPSATTGGLSGYTPDTSTNSGVASGYSTQNPTGGVATATTNGPGAALTHDAASNLPPYYALCFIQKA
jgi:hypothetical protein